MIIVGLSSCRLRRRLYTYARGCDLIRFLLRAWRVYDRPTRMSRPALRAVVVVDFPTAAALPLSLLAVNLKGNKTIRLSIFSRSRPQRIIGFLLQHSLELGNQLQGRRRKKNWGEDREAVNSRPSTAQGEGRSFWCYDLLSRALAGHLREIIPWTFFFSLSEKFH